MISQHMDLWDRGINTGLVGYVESNGVVREVQVGIREKDKDGFARKYYSTLLSGNIWLVIKWSMAREEGGVSATVRCLHQDQETGI